MGTGGLYRFNDGQREIGDHVYTTFEYPGGRTAVFSSVESNAWDHYYEAFFGTKGTLVLRGEAEAFLFDEGTGQPAVTGIEVTPRAGGPALEASESRVADAAGKSATGTTSGGNADRLVAYRNEISSFCTTIRTGRPLACGPDRAIGSARALYHRIRGRRTKGTLANRRRRASGAHVAAAGTALMTRFSRAQAVTLVLLRTLIGWHFLYEGYYKLALPAWSTTGQPLAQWSAAGYLRAATGPFASVFHAMAATRFVPWVDTLVPIVLVLVGLSLTLGLFTRLGCWARSRSCRCSIWPRFRHPVRRSPDRRARTCWSART